MQEREMLSLFLGTCEAVRAMHTYVPGPSATYPPSNNSTSTLVGSSQPSMNSKGKGRSLATSSVEQFEEREEAEEEAIRSSAGASEPLIGSIDRARAEAEVDETEAGDMPGLGETSGRLAGRLPSAPAGDAGASSAGKGQMMPWAHRDIKPANVMVSDSNTPVLMDFGSALPARISITSRSVALQQADDASEHCSMPYRAPELFDPIVGSELNEKVDVWSLGCTLFAMAYGHSPFETEGGNVTMAVRSGNYKFPDKDRGYSQGFRDLIKFMLVIEPKNRPDIHAVIERTKHVLSRVQ